MALQASKERWIQVDLKTQRLIAWEGTNPVYAIVISTGKASTPTRPGIFKIQQNRGNPHPLAQRQRFGTHAPPRLTTY
jgi:hypothetical protein